MAMDQNKWGDLLDQIDASSGSGEVYYMKQPKTRIRLVVPDGVEEDQFYAETSKFYQGKESTAFMIFAVVIGTSVKNDPNVDPTKVKAIRLPKTALRGIIARLAEGHELFSDSEGHGVTITKVGGQGSDRTSYDIDVSPKAVPINLDSLEWPSKDLWTIAAEEYQRSKDRDEKAKTGPVKGGRPSRNVPQAVDDDEDLPF